MYYYIIIGAATISFISTFISAIVQYVF